MELKTERLILRPWKESDAQSLYEYAKDPDVGPIAGWPPHKSVEESLNVIRDVFNGAECYAICEKENNTAIGAIELKLNGQTDMTDKEDECELGYWLGKPFWGRGFLSDRTGFCKKTADPKSGNGNSYCGTGCAGDVRRKYKFPGQSYPEKNRYTGRAYGTGNGTV